MRPIDGEQFVRRIRKRNWPLAYVPVIMVTGHTEKCYVKQARDAGVSEMLGKPVKAHDLFARVIQGHFE